MNKMAIEILESIRADPHHRRHADDPAALLTEMFTRGIIWRNLVIEHRAAWLWGLYAEEALRAEFYKRLDDKGFNAGFSFDISNVDEDGEPWADAYQLALDEYDNGTLVIEQPEATRVEVANWLALTPLPPMSGKEAQVVQKSLFIA
ncbi:MAG: hypothetical protein WC832_07575 [Anaerolineales bacterium]